MPSREISLNNFPAFGFHVLRKKPVFKLIWYGVYCSVRFWGGLSTQRNTPLLAGGMLVAVGGRAKSLFGPETSPLER